MRINLNAKQLIVILKASHASIPKIKMYIPCKQVSEPA
jgi:hypothetical protein